MTGREKLKHSYEGSRLPNANVLHLNKKRRDTLLCLKSEVREVEKRRYCCVRVTSQYTRPPVTGKIVLMAHKEMTACTRGCRLFIRDRVHTMFT